MASDNDNRLVDKKKDNKKPAVPSTAADRTYGAGYKLIGKNYETPDLYAKVTGNAKYAEDFRAEGMLFCKLLLSPMPHARVRHINPKAALAMPGVKAILTADDLPAPADTLTDNGSVIKASKWGERGLTMEPVYQGEPVLAVAAIDELTAAEAIEKIEIDFEPLPFVIDPLETLRPGGPNPRTDGNVWTRPASLTSRRKSTGVFRWAKVPTNGPTATLIRASRMRHSFLMIRSSLRTPAIRRSKPAARWPTGKTARFTFTPARRAQLKHCRRSRAG